jgi:PPOX class probable F420-dependent enzyme
MRLDPGECRDRLAAARVGTLGTVTPERGPHLVPITFALLPGATDEAPDVLVTAVDGKPKSTTNLARLRNIAENPRVAVLADDYDDDWSRLWWVRADCEGRVLPVTPDTADWRARLLGALAEKYPQYRGAAPTGPIIELRVRRMTGWSATGR